MIGMVATTGVLSMMTLQEAARAAGVGVRFDYEGTEYKLCKNGSILNMGTGKFAWGNAPVDTRISTTERSQELLYERWHAPRQEAARLAVQHATNDDGIATYEAADAYMLYALVRYGVLDDTQRLVDRVKAHEHVLQQIGADGRAPKQAQNSPTNGIQISIGADVAAQMMAQLMQQAQNRGILDE